MPYSLTIKSSEKQREVWDGDKSSGPSIPKRRSSISSPGELKFRSSNLTRTTSLSEDEVQHELSFPKVSLTPSVTSSRVERLVRERQLRRSGSCYALGDEVDGKSEALGGNGGMLGGGADRMGEWWAATDSPKSSHSKAGAHADGHESSGNLNDPRHRNAQRLLVVANRLPVSAIRLEGDKWDLQLSAGGLVSALLGMALASRNFAHCFF
jgi:hypothetical protein